MKDPRFAVAYNWDRQRRRAAPEELQSARMLAEEVALGVPRSETVERVLTELAHAHEARWTAFNERFAKLVCEDEQRRQAWIALLLSEVATAIRDPKALLLSSNLDADSLKARFEVWKEEKDPFSVWGSQHSYHIAYRGDRPFFHLYLLLLIDPTVWLHAMDGLPSPGMMEWAFFTVGGLSHDRDRIEALIPLAPPAFDAQGHWLPSRSVSALLLTRQIVDHASQLREAVFSRVRLARAMETAEQAGLEQELATVETEELPTWMRRAFELVLARPDGRHIAFGFLGHLARNVLIGQRHVPGHSWSAEQQAFRVLAETLAAAGIGIAEARKSWLNAVALEEQKRTSASATGLTQPTGEPKISAHEGEGARHLVGNGLPLLVGAAAMLGDEPKSLEEIRRFWDWFEELLIGRDPGLSFANYEATRVDLWRQLGVLLSRLDEPALRFFQLYVALEPQRRRAQFRYRYDDDDGELGSILLLRIGLFASLNYFEHAQGTHEREVAREWFWWLYEAARRLWLVAVHDYEREKRNLIPMCFAFMPFLFGDDLDGAVRHAMTPIANDAYMVSSAGWSLWKNGIMLDRLVPLLRQAGADIETALRDAYQWAKLTDLGPMPYGRENPEWPAALAELAGGLGLKLDAEPATQAPSHEGRAYRRDEFTRSIPWGAALLRRLDDDGCARVRCRPLEATGNTWLLQAGLPSTVSEKFGFSPEIRVLAVHGQVRGRDMRTAVQHPEDASQVDPDLLVIASDQPDLARRLLALAGPWGQRIPWPFAGGGFEPLQDTLREHLSSVDLFDYRDPVKGSALIGRCGYIDDLVSRVLRGHAVGVFGLRKVGKSSLLRAVADRIDPIGARRGMFASLTVPLPDAEPEALVVSLDVQGVAGRGLDVLLERLIAVLEDRLALARIPMGAPADAGNVVVQATMPWRGRPVNDDESEAEILEGHDIPARNPMDRLRDLLAIALERTALPVCFIFDEYDLLFEGYSGEPGIPGVEQLLAFLRAEAQATHRVSLVTIGRDPSFIDRPLLGGHTNPLAGWVQYLWLGPLKREEADELLVRLGKRVALDVGAATRETAWQWTGGHPLLLRQYGAALFELAHAPPTRPRPVPTDPIHQDAVELFLVRDAVYTITSEVRALLHARSPDALALLEELSSVSVAETEAIMKRYGGPLSRPSKMLTRFGIVAEDQAGLWVPGVFRDAFALPIPNAKRSMAGGA